MTTNVLSGLQLLDGGFATELERHGARIDGPLWSAHVLEEAPEKILAVHRDYLAAGAEILLTASYQASRRAYTEYGYTAERADAALLAAVRLARQAVVEFPARRTMVAASLGPFGAALHDGSEYHGNYGVSFDELVGYHRERAEVLAAAPANAQADILAFETIPSLEEARAVLAALADLPSLPVWLSFTCKDGEHLAHGEALAEVAAIVSGCPNVQGVGINCTAPKFLPSLIPALRSATALPILVYPNSGETWDGQNLCWRGSSDIKAYGEAAREWFALGAQIIGGCCRTTPEHIREVGGVI